MDGGSAGPLPVDDVLDEVVVALGRHGAAVLEAPPGAGKTTRVPLALLDAPWLGDQRIVMLEPRRVAARAAARRLAQQLGSRVGEIVGHRMRNDTRVGPDTRIEVVTEGVLTRMLQHDPGLDGVGVIVFDEFHERSLHADLGLALALEVRAALRGDLRLLVMSATLDGARVAAVMGDAPVVTSAGRQHEVVTHHHAAPAGRRPEDHLAEVVAATWEEGDGDVLGFLPGAAWIRRAGERLTSVLPADAVVTPLYGALPPDAQDLALRPDPRGRRKVVLATDIAETSLTIDGVAVVVDAGLRRAPRFDPGTGLTRLETSRISRASADQRRGRAGRQGPGVCHRLWSREDHRHLRAHDPPEIVTADLTALRLQLAHWGSDAGELTWLDPPPEHALAEAERLLVQLGAMADGRITSHGRLLSGIGAEPRLAHMMASAREHGLGSLACDVAGLLSSRDPEGIAGVDLRDRVLALRRARRPSGPLRDAMEAADRWRRDLEITRVADDVEATGLVTAMAFPDRIAQPRGGGWRLASGRGAELPAGDHLASADLLAVAAIDDVSTAGRIRLAAPLPRREVDAAAGHLVHRSPVVAWDAALGDVVAEHRTTLGALVLKREPIADPPAADLAAAWADAVRAEGLSILPVTEAVTSFRRRVAALRAAFGDDWPDLDDETLAATADRWLAPHLMGVRRRRDLARLDLVEILAAALTWDQRRRLDELAPTHVRVPTGNAIRLDYAEPTAPVLSVRVQEVFGLTETPSIADGRIDVVVHLLSPARRPVQVTTDLASFWRDTYPQVKGELKGRYPKHAWPDDPIAATPTDRTRPRR